MTVSVKVEQGAITGLTIENAEDDQTYLDRAKSGIFSEILEKQSAEEIDTVSGATYSSNGIIHATANALEIPEDEYAPRPGRDMKNKQKDHGHIVQHIIENWEQYEEKVKEYEDVQN